MSLLRTLNIGANGMTSASLGTSITGQNITNAATPGYSRQTVEQRARPIHYGGGVEGREAVRVADKFVDKRLTSATSLEGEATARAKTVADLDGIFAEDEGGIGASLDAFEGAVSDLAANPSDMTTRTAFLAAADQLTLSFRQASDTLTNARADANGRIVSEVDELNGKLDQIGSLNAQILEGSSAGQDVSTLLDNRDQIVRDIAEKVPVTVIEDRGSTVSLLLGGSRNLVAPNGDVSHLTTTVDSNGDRQVARETSSGPEDVTSLLTTGSLAGYINGRDGAIADARNSLDQLAFDISSAYNTAHSAGFGLDGSTGNNLFEPQAAVAGAASAMAVSSDVAGQPAKIAAGTATGVNGDNRNALAMRDLADASIALGGTASANGALAQIVGAAGSAVQSANNRADHATATRDQAQALRDSVSGVSSDEEMVNLMRYQRAFQASLRVIETADMMLGELLNMKR